MLRVMVAVILVTPVMLLLIWVNMVSVDVST